MHRALRSFREEFRATVVRAFAYVGALVVLAVVAARFFAAPEVSAAIDRAPRADWTALERPYHAFSLTIPNLPEADYAIHRHPAGGRKDILTVGAADSAGSRVMVEIYRPGGEHPRFGDPATEVAARTAELGGPYALTPAEALDSKFGRVAVFAFTATSDGRARNCLGFVRAFDEPRLQIAGWHCKGDAEVVERRTLACAIEGLSLLAAASEPKVQELFAHAEQRRTFCSPRRAARGAATLRRSDWIEAPQQPKLRRSAAAK